MKVISRDLKHIVAMIVAVIMAVSAANTFGQDRGFCSDNNWSSSDHVSFRDAREMTIPATGSLVVDSGQNGGIGIKGENRSDILVRACVQTWGKTEEAAKTAAANVRISTSGTIKAENSSDDRNWSVSFQILVPRTTNLTLTAHNGGISISGVDAVAEFETMNGGVHLSNVSGDFKGRTTNGGVHVELSGTTWRGSGLDLKTTNGGVHLTMPENYAAHIETGTVNGGYSSSIPALKITTEDVKGDWSDRARSKRIVTNINGGGAPIKLITTNGGVRISSTSEN